MDASEFLSMYPEFDSGEYGSTKVEQAIADAATEIDEDSWGVHYLRGLAALSAHLLAYRKLGQLSGGINRADTVAYSGEERIDFMGRGSSQSMAGVLEKTDYGQEFLRLQRKVAYVQPRAKLYGF